MDIRELQNLFLLSEIRINTRVISMHLYRLADSKCFCLNRCFALCVFRITESLHIQWNFYNPTLNSAPLIVLSYKLTSIIRQAFCLVSQLVSDYAGSTVLNQYGPFIVTILSDIQVLLPNHINMYQ